MIYSILMTTIYTSIYTGILTAQLFGRSDSVQSWREIISSFYDTRVGRGVFETHVSFVEDLGFPQSRWWEVVGKLTDLQLNRGRVGLAGCSRIKRSLLG